MRLLGFVDWKPARVVVQGIMEHEGSHREAVVQILADQLKPGSTFAGVRVSVAHERRATYDLKLPVRHADGTTGTENVRRGALISYLGAHLDVPLVAPVRGEPFDFDRLNVAGGSAN